MEVQQPRLDVDEETYRRAEQFLYQEADLLDTFALEDWLSLLEEDITLRIPTRSSRDPGSDKSEFSSETYYLREDYDMLRERVGRLQKEYAWSENPRSRVRHVIGNVQILDQEGNEVTVSNNQHVFRSYGDTPDHDMISAQRHTVLRDTDAGFRIADRTVYLDHTVLNTKNLTVPLL
jgi:3-phenylpropionate/cinnamic acid dioxygenase small subunit